MTYDPSLGYDPSAMTSSSDPWSSAALSSAYGGIDNNSTDGLGLSGGYPTYNAWDSSALTQAYGGTDPLSSLDLGGSSSSSSGGGLLSGFLSTLGSLVGIGSQAYLASQGIAANNQAQQLRAQPFTQRLGITSASGGLTQTGSLLLMGGVVLVAFALLRKGR